MKILLSPAKLLNFKQSISLPEVSICSFIEEADFLVNKLKKLSVKEIGKHMNISQELSEMNYYRYQNWEKPLKVGELSKPAITVFNGEVYKGFDAASLSTGELKNAQDKILILSGLYGVLKPFDLIYPYRLEMGTKWSITPKIKDLYQFWSNKILTYLNNELGEKEVIVNLASKEYSKVVPFKELNHKVITPVFKESKGDEFKVVMVYAKQARGLMAREIVKNDYKNVADLKGFDVEGYSFQEKMSSESEWVFVR